MFFFLLLLITCSTLVHGHSDKLSVHYDVKESICVATYSDGSGNSHRATHPGPRHIKCSTLSSIENKLKFLNSSVFSLADQLHELKDLHTYAPLPSSCQEILQANPQSPSGVYLIANPTTPSATTYVYCKMEELCGSGRGWTRVAYLDMSNTNEKCPDGFYMYQNNGKRACGRPQNSPAGCQASVKFSSFGSNYSQVCGRVIGYQYASPSGITGLVSKTIDQVYVDGISLTYGCSPRKHIWTFMAQVQDNIVHYGNKGYICPCANGSIIKPQSFIGNDYFCESGNNVNKTHWSHTMYTDDPLWDGKGCGTIETECCQVPGIPWFHKVLDTPTMDDIELRVCADQHSTDDEDSPVTLYEIYVK